MDNLNQEKSSRRELIIKRLSDDIARIIADILEEGFHFPQKPPKIPPSSGHFNLEGWVNCKGMAALLSTSTTNLNRFMRKNEGKIPSSLWKFSTELKGRLYKASEFKQHMEKNCILQPSARARSFTTITMGGAHV